jgi:hypothetical protein
MNWNIRYALDAKKSSNDNDLINQIQDNFKKKRFDKTPYDYTNEYSLMNHYSDHLPLVTKGQAHEVKSNGVRLQNYIYNRHFYDYSHKDALDAAKKNIDLDYYTDCFNEAPDYSNILKYRDKYGDRTECPCFCARCSDGRKPSYERYKAYHDAMNDLMDE